MGTDIDKTLKEFQEGSLLKRQGRPEEVAKAVLFLASNEDSSFITGENIIVDGGLIYT
jgi:NAD(P)-dependent dehydrogenase (short-subunit alcohol dehydrogenase family)